MSAWIMSAGFSFNVVNVVWPAFLIGIILIQIGKHRYFGDFLFGLSFLLFALGMLKQTGVEMDLASKPEVVAFFSSFKTNYGTILLFLLIRYHPVVPPDRYDPDGAGAEFRRADGDNDGSVRDRRDFHLPGYRAGHG